MTRIPLQPPRTLTYRLVEWYSRRRFGAVADPAAAMGHNMPVLMTDARHEMSLQKWHRAACRRLGIPDALKVHSLRHSFGTRLGELNTDVFTIKDVMGHSSVTVSEKYVHTSREVRRRAFLALSDANDGHNPVTVAPAEPLSD